jgi:hypothetical protein
MANQFQMGSTAAGGGVTPSFAAQSVELVSVSGVTGGLLRSASPDLVTGAFSIFDPLVRRVRFQRLYLRLFDLSEAAHDPSRAARLLLLSLVAYRHSVG